jgi:predicted DCC family thiol-disulfide oxidoreductase YuxK
MIFVALVIAAVLGTSLVSVFTWSLCRIAAKPVPKPLIDRIHQQIAEGRPTMPSQVESDSERERRLR